jgi:hypothetical protein
MRNMKSLFLITLPICLCACLPSEAQLTPTPGVSPVKSNFPARSDTSPDPRFTVGELLFQDDFNNGAKQWTSELEKGGTVEAKNGDLIIDVPAGCTVWFKPVLTGPVMIEYTANVISAGGPNDRVSDLNCFWMARDTRSPQDLFASTRSGKFSEYNQLLTYYVGLGGNGNTTSRLRRYIGGDQRPLLSENDLSQPADLLVPNTPQTIRLIAAGSLIQFYRDTRKMFELNDPAPYASGWFGLRTVTNHMAIRQFRVYRLNPAPAQVSATKL